MELRCYRLFKVLRCCYSNCAFFKHCLCTSENTTVMAPLASTEESLTESTTEQHATETTTLRESITETTTLGDFTTETTTLGDYITETTTLGNYMTETTTALNRLNTMDQFTSAIDNQFNTSQVQSTSSNVTPTIPAEVQQTTDYQITRRTYPTTTDTPQTKHSVMSKNQTSLWYGLSAALVLMAVGCVAATLYCRNKRRLPVDRHLSFSYVRTTFMLMSAQ